MANRPSLIDAAIAAAATVFALAAVVAGSDGSAGSTSTTALVFAVLGGAALIGRRRYPVVVLAVVTVAQVGLVATAGQEHALLPAAAIALYTVAGSGDRRVRLPIAFAAAAVMAVTVAAFEDDAFWPELASEAGPMLLPIAVAEAVRNRRERLENLIETEATARVQAERLRIARDLHDVVAHGLSTIAVQSGVAARLVERDPALAKEALEDINRTGKHSLDELRSMVGVLRSDDGAPLQPMPTDPNDLSDLLSAASLAGLEVSTEVTGSFPPDAGDAVVVAAHRILQEALTNVTRHAGAVPVEVAVVHADEAAVVRVTNGPGRIDQPTAPSTGVGVIGMTERAEALGGSLRAAPTTAGGFEVVATLPYYGRPQ